jgi:DNA ligase (NAD+)
MDYKSLKSLVIFHDKQYYSLQQPILSDEEYDGLYDQLVEMEKHQGWKDPDSPTNRIVAAQGKIKHPIPLYSLKKVYSESDIDPLFTVKLPKIDGVNLSAIYENGILQHLLTRGNGEYGESVMHLSKIIKSIPDRVNSEYTFNGEVVTDTEGVENFRNYVAGALGLKSAKIATTRNLRFIVHDVLGMQANYLDRIAVAKSVGFETILDSEYTQYPQDGVVYRTNSYELEQQLGYTSKFPRFAVALKRKEHFSAATFLTDIQWSIGRSGVVTPVGILEPITLDGATVSRVILHNIDFVEQHNLGRGDLVLIERRITPQFVKVLEHSSYPKFSIVDAKAQLGMEIVKKGPKLYVNSEDGYRLVEYFVKTLDIKGLGPASIKTLDITHPSQLYTYTNWALLGKNGEKIKYELSRPKEYATVLAALGIPGVGKETAKLIANNIPKFEDLRNIKDMAIRGIGPVTIEKILSWVEANEDWVVQLPYSLEQQTPAEEVAVRKVAISGKLDMTKKEMGDHLKKFNIVVVDTVSKDLYALIYGGTASEKTKKAEQYGIPIYDYWKTKAIILKGMI